MKIIGRAKVAKFKIKHARSRAPLDRFVSVLLSINWKNASDIKKTFNHADNIDQDNLYCFDIGGNNYRLIAVVKIINNSIQIKEIMTHSEYDKWNKKRS